MPIYEYQCAACGQVFEEIVFGEKAVPCPKCASGKTEKLISRTQRHRSGGGGGDYAESAASAPASSGGCAGCSGGSCSTCG
jgi:putative FmdB family regulatory protein